MQQVAAPAGQQPGARLLDAFEEVEDGRRAVALDVGAVELGPVVACRSGSESWAQAGAGPRPNEATPAPRAASEMSRSRRGSRQGLTCVDMGLLPEPPSALPGRAI